MAPTRDLAEQIHRDLRRLSRFLENPPVRTLLLVGGVNDSEQMRSLRQGVHIVVGTCGRIRDMVRRGKLVLGSIRFFVLDEADQLAADRESRRTVIDIYKQLGGNQGRPQVCFFSATLHNQNARQLADSITKYATWVDLKGRDVVPETVHHVVVPVSATAPSAPWGNMRNLDQYTDGVHANLGGTLNRHNAMPEACSQIIKRQKLETLKRVIDTYQMETCMIFVRTNVDADNLERFLINAAGNNGQAFRGKRESGKENPYSCVVVAGKRQQRERRENLAAFRDGDVRFLSKFVDEALNIGCFTLFKNPS